MTNGFEAADAAFEAAHSSSPDSNSMAQAPVEKAEAAPQATAQQAQAIIHEIDKLEKFKLEGQEMTYKDLKAAMMRQKDYTTKTQALAEERKYYENLAWDLKKVEANPQLAQEFIKTYPEKFHSYLEAILKNNQEQQTASQAQSRPQIDVATLSRLERLEKSYNEQEVAKNEATIKATMDGLKSKYPDAHDRFVLPVAWELADKKGEQLTQQDWEEIYKSADSEMKNIVKAKMSEYQKKQLEANSKAKDVGSGGGTVGQAPKKFKNLREVGEYAEASLTKRS